MRVIVALSGGKASAFCADWALKNFPKEDVVFYFNDTLWEHPDLYRFLDDLEEYYDHPIFRDTDGRTPEEIFVDKRYLGNSRAAPCSVFLKAKRMQEFYQDGDVLVFGIGNHERERATRLIQVYQLVAAKTGKWCSLRFPLIEDNISREEVQWFVDATGLETPELYRLGFDHNNCSGGCVRAGKKHWKLLLDVLPDVYAQREAMENRMRQFLGKDVTIIKDETLEHFRLRVQAKEEMIFDAEDSKEVECIGICENVF